jgi:glutathione S-transferase
MKLYYFETINGKKACAVAQYVAPHLDSPIEFIRIDLSKGEHKSPQYLAINPNGKIPALQDGDVTLWESNAIMCHLARRAKSDLWPIDPQKQIEVMKWLCWNSEHFTRHAGTLYFNYMVKPKFGLGERDEKAVEEAINFVKPFCEVLDRHLDGRTFLLGDHLTVADFAVAVTVPYAAQIQLPVDGMENIARWASQLDEIPAWRDPFPAAKAAAA